MRDDHREAFLEEAEELLVSLEASLLELDKQPDDMDLIQGTFRALHTLKGSGAMFGFEEMSRFAHEVETAFDHVREGRLAVTPELVNITLGARDQIRGMLNAPEDAPASNSGGAAEILNKLRALLPAPGKPGSTAPGSLANSESTAPGTLCRWHIEFRPGQEIFLKGTNPLLLFRELGELGDLRVEAGVSRLPSLAEMQPENCYMDWDLELETNRGLEAIRDVHVRRR
jgi:two-component system chemotaxis sensor kinase CheA